MLLYFSISFFKIVIMDQYIDFMTHKWVTTHNNLNNTGSGEQYTGPSSGNLYTTWESVSSTVYSVADLPTSLTEGDIPESA